MVDKHGTVIFSLRDSQFYRTQKWLQNILLLFSFYFFTRWFSLKP
ncbi:hypothetical protein K1719_021287, partial [Acacia pycnantha]